MCPNCADGLQATDGDASCYTNSLLLGPINKIAQKVGKEGVEVALAGVNEKEDRLISECADLLYHMLVLLKVRDLSLNDLYSELEARRS